MKFSTIAASAAIAATASASDIVYTTEVVTAYTTFCPSPTVLTIGATTHTVTEVCADSPFVNFSPPKPH